MGWFEKFNINKTKFYLVEQPDGLYIKAVFNKPLIINDNTFFIRASKKWEVFCYYQNAWGTQIIKSMYLKIENEKEILKLKKEFIKHFEKVNIIKKEI